jgi:predicted Zn-dependent peptidase
VAEGHPSGSYATEETTSSITSSDLVAFHGRFYQPSATVIAVSGDFDSEEMVATLEELFGAWSGEPVDYPDLPAYNPDPGPKIYYGFKEIGQSVILLGHPSVTTYSEAYNDFNVANEILGGDFSSRLVSEIRVRRGLAYSTGSFITESFEYPSNFVAYAISPAQATGEVIELLLAEIRRIQEEGVSEEELERSRQTILNQSLFRFTSSSAVNERTARVQLLGLEPGYYERYLENLQTITAEEVREAAVRELRPDEVVIMVVGDESLFDRPLSDFGEVVTIELE